MIVKSRYTLKWLTLAVTLYATVCMLHWPIGFTFFTQLSNLFAAAVAAAQLKKSTPLLHTLKYMAVLSLFITFLVYLTAIASLYPGGLVAAYLQDHGASFCMHLLNPALVITDFYLHDAKQPYSRMHILLGLLPMLFYLAFLLILGRLGLWWHGGMAAPYPFLNYLAPAGWFGFRPETAGFTTFGIGVFYVILLLLVAFGLLSFLQWKLAGFTEKTAGISIP